MKKITTKNQVRKINSENKDLRKIIFKNNGASMILFKDIDYVNASIRVKTLKRIFSDWRGEFIIVR